MSHDHATWKLSVDKSFNVVNEDGNVLIPWLYTDFTVEDMQRAVACWNAFDGVRIEMVEAIAGTGAMQSACNAMSKLPAAQSDLAAARALLSDVLSTSARMSTPQPLIDRIRAFLKGGA